MLSLGPHAGFILAAYAVTVVAVTALVLVTLADDRRQRQLLAELDRKGVKRRPAAKASKAIKPKGRSAAAGARKQ